MTGIQDDLATLRQCVETCAMESGAEHNGIGEAALARVEAEIAQLEERANFADAVQYRQRAEAAEAEVARLKDGLRRIIELGNRAEWHDSDSLIAMESMARALLAEDGAALTAGDVPAKGLKGRTHVGRSRSASPAVNADKIERLLRKAERDARILDGRDFKMRPFSEAYRLLDVLRDLLVKGAS